MISGKTNIQFTRFKGKLTNKDELKWRDDTDIKGQLRLSLLCTHHYDNYGLHHKYDYAFMWEEEDMEGKKDAVLTPKG